MLDLGSDKVRELLEATGRARSEISELTGEAVTAINQWASRGRVPASVVDILETMAEERSTKRRLEIAPGVVAEADLIELSDERLREMAELDVETHELRAEAVNPILASIELEDLVAEIERRGWKVSISLKSED
jgi:transcriptional regulator with XRE-family HTH domain